MNSEANYGSEFAFCMQLEETILSQETLFEFGNVSEFLDDQNINYNSQYILNIGENNENHKS